MINVCIHTHVCEKEPKPEIYLYHVDSRVVHHLSFRKHLQAKFVRLIALSTTHPHTPNVKKNKFEQIWTFDSVCVCVCVWVGVCVLFGSVRKWQLIKKITEKKHKKEL